MTGFLESQRETIAAACAKHGVLRVDAYFDLLDDLRSILGGKVDLVMADAVKNRYIAADIKRTKQVLYAA